MHILDHFMVDLMAYEHIKKEIITLNLTVNEAIFTHKVSPFKIEVG